MNTLIILVVLGILSAVTVFSTNWLALIPWRQSKQQHWSERARLYHPVRVAATANLWTVPAICVLTGAVVWPDISPHWLLVAIISALGTTIGTFPMNREVFPRMSLRTQLRQSTMDFFIGQARWLIFLATASVMPQHFNYGVLIISGVVVLVWACWKLGLWRVLGQITGLLQPAPERLCNIVNDVSTKTKIPCQKVWLIRIQAAQAIALQGSKSLLFSERLLELLSDEEISAVCAHELGHLFESFADRCKRSIRTLAFLPWLYFKPIVCTYGHFGFLRCWVPHRSFHIFTGASAADWKSGQIWLPNQMNQMLEPMLGHCSGGTKTTSYLLFRVEERLPIPTSTIDSWQLA
jgi:hypothetical protein